MESLQIIFQYPTPETFQSKLDNFYFLIFHSLETTHLNNPLRSSPPLSTELNREDPSLCTPLPYTIHMAPPPTKLYGGTKILSTEIPSGKRTLTLIGRSWAGDSTAFVVPELNAGFDAGYIVQGKRLARYFITHVHCDHSHMLTHVKSRSKPPTIYVPKESVEVATGFLDAAQQMTSHLTQSEYAAFPWEPAFSMVGVSPGERFLVDKKESLYCDAFRCDHTVPCLGYKLSRVLQKLRPEYAGLSGREIAQLRKDGVDVMSQVDTPVLAFLGDTSVEGVFGVEATRGLLADVPLIIVECSFLSDDHREQAHNKKHVLWSELKPYVIAQPQTLFVLMHFSHRWSAPEVRKFFAEENLDNVLPWVGPVESDEMEEVWGHS